MQNLPTHYHARCERLIAWENDGSGVTPGAASNNGTAMLIVPVIGNGLVSGTHLALDSWSSSRAAYFRLVLARRS
jgi:hypothetical protein